MMWRMWYNTSGFVDVYYTTSFLADHLAGTGWFCFFKKLWLSIRKLNYLFPKLKKNQITFCFVFESPFETFSISGLYFGSSKRISILSSIEKINFKDERDLLSKIYPYGVIIADRDKRAVYLPVVWEQLPDREVFLNSLKEKAGLPPNYFSRTFEAYKFNTLYISD